MVNNNNNKKIKISRSTIIWGVCSVLSIAAYVGFLAYCIIETQKDPSILVVSLIPLLMTVLLVIASIYYFVVGLITDFPHKKEHKIDTVESLSLNPTDVTISVSSPHNN
ncbi:MAG: hypothetical protein J1F71_03595 [Clostridiales bacterium]|nr:hypothetical protein [Clostridiales bacterium]